MPGSTVWIQTGLAGLASLKSRLTALGRRLWRVDVLFWELSAVAWLLFLPYILTAHGHLDYARHALGRDFVNYWTAAHLAFTPHRLDIFSPSLFLGWEHRLFDPRLPFHFWSYPPPMLLVVAPLALLPYVPGLIVWSLAGIAVLIPAVRAYFKGAENRWLLMAAPAVAVNIGLGQNGALTAALLLGGLALWRTRPKLSGFVLALLVFKPQLALLLPIAVVAERRWSTRATAALTVIAVLVLSTLIFGVDAWNGFFGPAMTTQRIMLSQGRGPFQWMMPSAFMAGRVAGLSVGWALLVQAPVSLFAGWLVWRAYRRDGDAQGKGAILVMATFLASPQMFNYDLIPGAAAALVLLRRDRTIVGFCLAIVMWALPVLLLATQVVHIAVGPFVIAAVTVRLAAVCGAIRLMRWPFRWPFPRRAFRPGPR
jgi:hypothetical protein